MDLTSLKWPTTVDGWVALVAGLVIILTASAAAAAKGRAKLGALWAALRSQLGRVFMRTVRRSAEPSLEPFGVLMAEPRLVTATDKESVAILPSRVLRLPRGALSVWVYVSHLDLGIRRLVNNRYLFAHTTNPLGPYKNVFSLARGPKYWAPAREPQWVLWMSADDHEKRLGYADTRDLDPGWHHFVVRWDHGKPNLEFLIDGTPRIQIFDYEEYWPVEYATEIHVGYWPRKWAEHFAETWLWRAQALEFFPDQAWLREEGLRPKPDVPA